MIERLVGDAVVAVDVREDVPDAPLFPEEEDYIAFSVQQRRIEFATARVCARRALARLGVPPVPVLPGARGEPVWPQGVVGSITHCTGYRGVVLGRAAEVLTIGIDAEPNEPLKPGILPEVSLPAEQARVRQFLAAAPGICWDRLLFSAKESVYKAWFGLARRSLGFDQAQIAFHRDGGPAGGVDAALDAGSFTARLLVRGPLVQSVELRGFSGRWMVCDGIVLTSIVLLRDPVARTAPVGPTLHEAHAGAFAGRV